MSGRIVLLLLRPSPRMRHRPKSDWKKVVVHNTRFKAVGLPDAVRFGSAGKVVLPAEYAGSDADGLPDIGTRFDQGRFINGKKDRPDHRSSSPGTQRPSASTRFQMMRHGWRECLAVRVFTRPKTLCRQRSVDVVFC